jgi:hypothetical protein
MRVVTTGPKPGAAEALLAQFTAAAESLETDQLVHLYGTNILMSEKYPKREDLPPYTQILGRELVRRGVNPYYLTADEYRRVFAFNICNHDGREQQMRACRNLMQRAGTKREYADVDQRRAM